MTVSQQIIDVMDSLFLRFGVAVDWTSENVFPYIQELAGKFITYEIATSCMYIVIALLIATIVIVLIKLINDKKINDEDGDFVIVILILSALALFIIFAQLFDIIACIVFPEKELFEYVRSLIKTL